MGCRFFVQARYDLKTTYHTNKAMSSKKLAITSERGCGT
jgi:hypothetical protein